MTPFTTTTKSALRFQQHSLAAIRSTSMFSSSSSPNEMSSSRPTTTHELLKLKLNTHNDMIEFGSLMAMITTPPDSILLLGDLGSGKTTFSKGFIQTKTSDFESRITSPTYLLSNTYEYYEEDNNNDVSASDDDSVPLE